MEKQVYFTVDSDELISLRDFGYLADDELEDAEAITNALHTVISDLWKMKVETEKPNRKAEIFGYKANEVMEKIIVNEDMRVGDSILFINNDGTDFLDSHLYRIKNILGKSGLVETEDIIMAQKQIYCMGRSEYLAEFEGYSLIEGYKIAEKEWDERN